MVAPTLHRWGPPWCVSTAETHLTSSALQVSKDQIWVILSSCEHQDDGLNELQQYGRQFPPFTGEQKCIMGKF